MVNIKEKKIEVCCECKCELLPYEKYVCDSCRRMILEAERKKEQD
jgi:hypothetical protein